MGMLESQLSAEFSPISQLTVKKHLNNSQLSVKILAESQLSVNPIHTLLSYLQSHVWVNHQRKGDPASWR